MSAFAAIFRRDNSPVEERALAVMQAALAHHGIDGSDRWLDGPVAMAHEFAWSTPEEVGARQPLRSGARALVFDGRLDNRRELAAELELDVDSVSDAGLVLVAHHAWGERCCERLLGPFAFALYEVEERRWLLARDALGDRTLFFAEAGAELLIASEECALLAHPEMAAEVDSRRLAHFFAGSVPGDGSTFFEGVRELLPGHAMVIDGASMETRRYWEPPTGTVGGRRTDDDLAGEYRELLERAVECRLRGRGRPAILMSGGLDSTSMTALAAEVEPRLLAVSWTFDQLAECDERFYIRQVLERHEFEWIEVPADDLGPSSGGDGLVLNPNSPEESPYRRLKAAAYEAAALAGARTVLSGGSADALYTGFERWFREMILSGRPLAALMALSGDVRHFGLRTAFRRAGARRPGRRRPPKWLTAPARELLEAETVPRPSARIEAATGARAARSLTLERFHTGLAGVDLRHPYRDRRLVEFMLQLPARQLYDGGRFKAIARRALRDRLPEGILGRREPTLLTPLFERAIRGEGRPIWEALLFSREATWPDYVDRQWVRGALERSSGPLADVALWNCLSYELWRQLTTNAGSPSSVMPSWTSR